VSGKAVIQALERDGFMVIRQRGSHIYLRKPAATTLVTVPIHGNRDLPAGTLRSILRQAGLSIDQLVDLLKG
jgi:predicted RNA binding protein YcfA (HicA-like mRNA interferase family)